MCKPGQPCPGAEANVALVGYKLTITKIRPSVKFLPHLIVTAAKTGVRIHGVVMQSNPDSGLATDIHMLLEDGHPDVKPFLDQGAEVMLGHYEESTTPLLKAGAYLDLTHPREESEKAKAVVFIEAIAELLTGQA